MERGRRFIVSLLTAGLLSVSLMTGCGNGINRVHDYLQNAEVQYQGEVQQENIVTACRDILSLTGEKLREKRYRDYSGREHVWDLPTLIYRHFTPDAKGKNLGTDFYREVKTEAVKKEIEKILKRIGEGE